MKSVIVISPEDNVAIVLRDVAEGEQLDANGRMVVSAEDISYTHKIALEDIAAGGEVIKYGECIAIAAREIKKGEWVHVHNLVTDLASA